MLAAVAKRLPAARLAVGDVEGPAPPASHEALVRVQACGICGTDLHILAGTSYRPMLPFVLGHEPVGMVEALGNGPSAGVTIGDRVAMTIFEGCGACRLCRLGDQRLCPNLRSIVGVTGRSGGFAELLLVPTEQLVPVPAGLGPLSAAGLVDAGATAANSVRQAGLDDVSDAVVVGGGPVGFLVAELLRLRGINALVVEPNDVRRGELEVLGHRTTSALADVQTSPGTIFECSGAAGVAVWAAARLRAHGRLFLIGYRLERAVDFSVFARKELRVLGVRSGRREDLETVLIRAARGELRVPTPRVWPLRKINEALAELRGGRVPGKAVIRCQRSTKSPHGEEANEWIP